MPTYCLDYQPAVAQGAGIGRYTRVLAQYMPSMLDADEQLRLFCCDFHRRLRESPVPGAQLRAFRMVPGAIMQKAWTRLRFPPIDWFAGRAELFHFTNFVTRPISSGKSVVTVHDMSFERFPQFAEERNCRYLHANVRRSTIEADAVIADSEFSKREIEELIPEVRGKVHAVLLGISSDFAPASPEKQASVREQLGLNRPFILTVGTVEPRKNLPFLVDVFERLAPMGYDLVVAGAPGWRCEPIFKRFEETRFKEQFHYVRFIPDGMLSALYSAASLFAVTSHYEGFGFPPLESMACGTPVISSDGGSLAEVLGEGATIMHSFDADMWAQEALALLTSVERRHAAIVAGRAKAASYTWQNTVRDTLKIYRKVTGQ